MIKDLIIKDPYVIGYHTYIPALYITLKPIFHWKWGSHWLPNANEIDTKKKKCTWPTQEICVWDPTQPIFH